jgi:hypothetical protein
MSDVPQARTEHIPIYYSGGRIRLPKREKGNEPITTLQSLQIHLQTALAVELSTIPLYLYGIFSVDQSGTGSSVAQSVKSNSVPLELTDYPHNFCSSDVVNEEMLHLALVGNTLRATGGAPTLYDPKIIPQYPGPMIGRVPELILQLRPMTKDNLDTFIQV